jgi:transmembrane sensor
MMRDDKSSPDDPVRRRAKDWVVQIATGGATKADLQALNRWREESPDHAAAYADACRLWEMLGSPLHAASRASDKIELPGIHRPVGRRALLGGGLAATAAMAAGVAIVRPPFELWPSFSEFAADYHTGAGEQRTITLADHGLVEMNTRTSLNVHKGEATSDSIELVTGEAAVAAGPRPVVVHAGSGRSSASDAQFTVRCDGANVRVTCLSGIVEVALRGHRTTVEPQQQLAYAADEVGDMTSINPDIVAGWRSGLLIFQDEPLSRVVEEVNRYRPGRIILMNATLGERRITARFKIARLDAVLMQFQQVFGAKVTSLGSGFVVLT